MAHPCCATELALPHARPSGFLTQCQGHECTVKPRRNLSTSTALRIHCTLPQHLRLPPNARFTSAIHPNFGPPTVLRVLTSAPTTRHTDLPSIPTTRPNHRRTLQSTPSFTISAVTVTTWLPILSLSVTTATVPNHFMLPTPTSQVLVSYSTAGTTTLSPNRIFFTSYISLHCSLHPTIYTLSSLATSRTLPPAHLSVR